MLDARMRQVAVRVSVNVQESSGAVSIRCQDLSEDARCGDGNAMSMSMSMSRRGNEVKDRYERCGRRSEGGGW